MYVGVVIDDEFRNRMNIYREKIKPITFIKWLCKMLTR